MQALNDNHHIQVITTTRKRIIVLRYYYDKQKRIQEKRCPVANKLRQERPLMLE